jgi:hypothetical protein
MATVENLTSHNPAVGTAGGGDDRRFDFFADTFAFPNELVWEYRLDAPSGGMTFHRRDPKPSYSHRCFVIVRAARQFFFHARFDLAAKPVAAEVYRSLIRTVVQRNPRQRSSPARRVVFPGFAGLRSFSVAHPEWLKAECGRAWHSYVLRSHWRMVLPISRHHQQITADRLVARVAQNTAPIIHLVKFPALTINHGMVLIDVSSRGNTHEFTAYDPNNPSKPIRLTFDGSRQTFHLPSNSYWPGGDLNVIEIFRHWLM